AIFVLQSPLFNAIAENSYIFNVHSFYAEESPYTIARCEYGISYAAAIQKDNYYGVQFHTERSAAIGDKILKNFLDIV
ncbi:MAG: glutamine amidotransferase-related protein, partial [Chitinophagaceae bacterium]